MKIVHSVLAGVAVAAGDGAAGDVVVVIVPRDE